MSRKYDTKHGKVVIKEYRVGDGMMGIVAYLLKHGELIECTRCKASIADGTYDDNKAMRKQLIESVLEKYETSRRYTFNTVRSSLVKVVSRRHTTVT
jgi:electron transfer flavoprotein alpha subunit